MQHNKTPAARPSTLRSSIWRSFQASRHRLTLPLACDCAWSHAPPTHPPTGESMGDAANAAVAEYESSHDYKRACAPALSAAAASRASHARAKA